MRNLRRSCPGLSLLAALTLVGACQKAPTAPMSQPLVQEGVTVTLTSAELQYLLLESPSGAVLSREPLLVVRLKVTNDSAADVRYDVGSAAAAGSQANSALLFAKPGPDQKPTDGVNVPMALLGQYEYLDDPVREATAIKAGESLEDVILFTAPVGVTDLVLSLPPTVFGAANKLPAYFEFSVPAGEVTPPAPAAVGEAISGDGFTFKVASATTEWVPLDSASEGSGFSERALFRVNFEVTNTSDAAIEYVPTSANRAMDPPTLVSADGQVVARAEFPANVTPTGLTATRQPIAAGATLRSWLLFERPAQSVTEVVLTFPGKRLGRSGAARVSLPYSFQDPPKPEALTPRVVTAPTGATPTGAAPTGAAPTAP